MLLHGDFLLENIPSVQPSKGNSCRFNFAGDSFLRLKALKESALRSTLLPSSVQAVRCYCISCTSIQRICRASSTILNKLLQYVLALTKLSYEEEAASEIV